MKQIFFTAFFVGFLFFTFGEIVATDSDGNKESYITLDDLVKNNILAFAHVDFSGAIYINSDEDIILNTPTTIATGTRFFLARGGRLIFGRGSVEVVDPAWFGASGDGISDDTAALRQSMDSIGDGMILDLQGRHYVVYSDWKLMGQKEAEESILLLSGRSNITIRNGTIAASKPGPTSKKQVFPSTMAIDLCHDVALEGLRLIAKGENFGDSDSSNRLKPFDRAGFLATSGGHALVISRTNGVRIQGCSFLGAGSTAAFYASSSSDLSLDGCFASALSLGYFAFAFDAWCGSVTDLGVDRFTATITDCSSSSLGSRYGSKGCVGVEDRNVIVNVVGGNWADAFANGRNHDLGAAFTVTSATLSIVDATVSNCAAVGRTGQSSTFPTTLSVSHTKAKLLRTAGHIQTASSFGETFVNYTDCDFEFKTSGSSLWPEMELAQRTILANQKIEGAFLATFSSCFGRDSDLIVANSRAVVGGVKFDGGSYSTQRIARTAGYRGRRNPVEKGIFFSESTTVSFAAPQIFLPLIELDVGSIGSNEEVRPIYVGAGIARPLGQGVELITPFLGTPYELFVSNVSPWFGKYLDAIDY